MAIIFITFDYSQCRYNPHISSNDNLWKYKRIALQNVFSYIVQYCEHFVQFQCSNCQCSNRNYKSLYCTHSRIQCFPKQTCNLSMNAVYCTFYTGTMFSRTVVLNVQKRTYTVLCKYYIINQLQKAYLLYTSIITFVYTHTVL